MTSLSDLLNETKTRLKNPFVVSFILSWLIWNWKIFIGLFWINHDQLKNIGFESHLSFVAEEINSYHSLLWPLLSAIALNILLPFIRNVFEWYQALMVNWGEKWVLSASKNGAISIEKYLDEKQKITALTERITSIANREIGLLANNNQLQENLSKANQDIANLNRLLNLEKDKYDSIDDIKVVNGRWDVKPPLDGFNEVQIKEDVVEVNIDLEKIQRIGTIRFAVQTSRCLYVGYQPISSPYILFFTFYTVSSERLDGLNSNKKSTVWRRI